MAVDYLLSSPKLQGGWQDMKGVATTDTIPTPAHTNWEQGVHRWLPASILFKLKCKQTIHSVLSHLSVKRRPIQVKIIHTKLQE